MPVRQQSGQLSPFKTKNKSTQRQKHTQTTNCFAFQLIESSLNEIRAILHTEIDCMLSGAYLKSCNFEKPAFLSYLCDQGRGEVEQRAEEQSGAKSKNYHR